MTSIHSNRLATCPILYPNGGGSRCGKYWRKYHTSKQGEGDACLTCEARARSVETRAVVRTRHEWSAEVDHVTVVVISSESLARIEDDRLAGSPRDTRERDAQGNGQDAWGKGVGNRAIQGARTLTNGAGQNRLELARAGVAVE